MNKQRRSEIRLLRQQLEELSTHARELSGEEEDYYENMPAGIQESDRGNTAYEDVQTLNNAADRIDEAVAELEELD